MILKTVAAEYVFEWADARGSAPAPAGGYWEFAELAFGSNQQALLFLRRFSALYEYRSLLNEKFPGQTFRWGIAEIEAKLADLLAKRRLVVTRRWRRATGSVTATAEATKVPRKEVAERSEPAEPATFLPNHDPNAQAETLADAANDGEAFCEECEKARQAAVSAAPASPPEPSEFSPNHDGDAQAAALTAASKNGVPFCEECEKAKQAA